MDREISNRSLMNFGFRGQIKRIGIGLTIVSALTISSTSACKLRSEETSSSLMASSVTGDSFKQNFQEAFEFIDFFDMIVAMGANNPSPWTRYDNDSRFQIPMLTKWRQAKQMLTSQKSLNEDLILKVFRILREKPNGTYRSEPVVAGGDYTLPEYAGEQGFFVTSAGQVNALQQNPYLVTTIARTTQKAPQGMVYARYEYPSVRTWQRFAKLLSPSLVSELKSLPANTQPESPLGRNLTSKIITELVKNLMTNAKRFTPTQTYQYFISIHPFDDTNGRTARLIYFHLNNQRALILRNFDLDTFSTVEEFSALVEQGTRQWSSLTKDFDAEYTTKKASGRMPDYYNLESPWLIAVNRLDMVPTSCLKRSELVAAARSYFNQVAIKQRIDHKDFSLLDAEINKLFGPQMFNCN